jgi:hypothetical protein
VSFLRRTQPVQRPSSYDEVLLAQAEVLRTRRPSPAGTPLRAAPWFRLTVPDREIHRGRVSTRLRQDGFEQRRERRLRALPDPAPRGPDDRTIDEMKFGPWTG